MSGERTQLDALEDELASPDWMTRSKAVARAADLLQSAPGIDAVATVAAQLQRLTADPRREVRAEVAFAASFLGESRSFDPITTALADDCDAYVKRAARAAIKKRRLQTRAAARGEEDVVDVMERVADIRQRHGDEVGDLVYELGLSLYEKIAAFVCHDIAGVLGALDVTHSLLERDLVRRKVARIAYTDHMATARRHVHLLEAIARDMKIYASTEELTFDRVWLHAMVGEAVEVVRRQAADGVTFEADVDRTLSLDAPRPQLVRALINLIKNGAEAIDGTGRVTLTAQAQEAEGRIVILIEDTGGGFSQKEVPMLLQPGMTTKRGPGRRLNTGMGLAITQRIIEHDCGGELELTSRGKNRGATARLVLPMERAS